MSAKPAELIAVAKNDYKQVYADFEILAKKIAEKHKLGKATPKDVMQHLKKEKVTNAKEVLELYKNADKRLESIIRKNKIVSLPDSPLVIRVASEAESLAAPFPI